MKTSLYNSLIIATALLAFFWTCTKEDESSTKKIWYCSECCDSLGNKIEHMDLTQQQCQENHVSKKNNNEWTWTFKEVKSCGDLPCMPDNP